MTRADAVDRSISFDYQAFGLTVRSCVPLPAMAAKPGATPDVHIRYGAVESDLPGELSRNGHREASSGDWLLAINGVARYRVRDGREITIDRHRDATDVDLRLFLLGSTLGALFHQRDELVLHASAVAVGGGAAGFLGASGSGKSTLAAGLVRRGCRVLTDDLCVMRSEADGELRAQPGLPHLKLCPDALKQLDVVADGLAGIGSGLEKRALPVGDDAISEARPITRLYVLEPADTDRVSLTPLAGAAKFRALVDHTYRLSYVDGPGARARHFQHVVAMARRTLIVAVQRPRASFQLDALLDCLIADFAA